MLRSMDVPVRSHLSQLSDEQIARLRARWEREKRARQEKPAAAPARRRRGTAAAASAAAPAAPAPAPKRRPTRLPRGHRAGAAARLRTSPRPRKSPPRTKPKCAAQAANIEPAVSRLEEELLVADPAPEAPARQAIEESRITAYSSPPTPARPSAPRAPDPGAYSRSGDATTAAAQRRRLAPANGAEWQRPRPVVPGPPRPKPASSGGYPPRPIASAAPGGAQQPHPARGSLRVATTSAAASERRGSAERSIRKR